MYSPGLFDMRTSFTMTKLHNLNNCNSRLPFTSMLYAHACTYFYSLLNESSEHLDLFKFALVSCFLIYSNLHWFHVFRFNQICIGFMFFDLIKCALVSCFSIYSNWHWFHIFRFIQICIGVMFFKKYCLTGVSIYFSETRYCKDVPNLLYQKHVGTIWRRLYTWV